MAKACPAIGLILCWANRRRDHSGTTVKFKTRKHAATQLQDIDNIQEKMERVAGIEPAYSAWKAAALPLSYTRADS